MKTIAAAFTLLWGCCACTVLDVAGTAVSTTASVAGTAVDTTVSVAGSVVKGVARTVTGSENKN
jgi:hypothetical protein